MPEMKSVIDCSNIGNCTSELFEVYMSGEEPPHYPPIYEDLIKDLDSCMPEVSLESQKNYYDNFYQPFVSALKEMKPDYFYEMMYNKPDEWDLMMDIAKAIVQNSRSDYSSEIAAFHEVVSDLYDGFLYKEVRSEKKIELPDLSTVAPIVKFGDEGAYTYPATATRSFGLKAAIVNLPLSNSLGGLFAWTSLGHEVAGHDILHADIGLREELEKAMWDQMKKEGIDEALIWHWASRIDEVASDVLGILNMGPMAGVGTVITFRALNAIESEDIEDAVLSNRGDIWDEHPADILRGYLAAGVVGLLSFKEAKDYSDLIRSWTDEDLKKQSNKIWLGWRIADVEQSKLSAVIAAKAIADTQVKSLENHSLRDIQDWKDEDEGKVKELCNNLFVPGAMPDEYKKGLYATHAVAAAAKEALKKDAYVPRIFDRLMTTLKIMHDNNLRYDKYS